MDFDNAKENIKPLASGRNVSMLHASLRTDAIELLEQRRQYEHEINNYQGEDPLEPWFSYIDWIEQSCPSGGKESGLNEVLVKCLTRFENNTKYYQDERMVKLYIKLINELQDPMEKYEALYKAGIGTMVADFYISWAYVADLCGNSRKADEIFLHGIKCNARPKEVLEEAHQHFRIYVSQRFMYKDDHEVLGEANRQINERRLALTSLRKHGRKGTVGSIRTGVAVKSYVPGTLNVAPVSTNKDYTAPKVYCDENYNPMASSSNRPALVAEENVSAVRMLIDAATNLENEKEPGPWNKAHNKKRAGKLFGKKTRITNLEFDIHEDMDIDDASLPQAYMPAVPIPAFKYPKNFVDKNNPQADWVLPVTTEEQPEPRSYPQYNKCMLYPRPNMEFQLEELRVYKLFKENNIINNFTTARDPYWSVGDVNARCRLYPNFAKKNLPQQRDAVDEYYEPPKEKNLVFDMQNIYNNELREEFQFEELMWQKRTLKLRNTQYSDDAMEETICATSERVKSRQSFFPTRKSIMPTKLPIESERMRMDNQSCSESSGRGDSLMAKLLFKETNSIATPPIVPAQRAAEGDSLIAKLLSKESPLAQSQLSAKQVREVGDDKLKIREEENAVGGAAGGLGFEIYEDTTTPKILAHVPASVTAHAAVNADQENKISDNFAFKAPLTPLVVPSVVKTHNKLPFELYTDKDEGSLAQPSNKTCGYFDADETCSTQQFNIFLKAQGKVSTPNMAQKVAPRFSLKPLPISIPAVTQEEIDQQKENVVEIAVDQSGGNTELPQPQPLAESTVDTEKIGALEEVNKLEENSPQPYFKNLSTILETSEHGSSHTTTAASRTATKSSCVSSPEHESNAKLQCELETVLEQPSREQSINQSTTTTTTTTSSLPSFKSAIATKNENIRNDEVEIPEVARFKNNDVENVEKIAGNFMRLEQREETAQLSLHFSRFQEDKTETLPNMMLAAATSTGRKVTNKSGSKFQVDETETFSKLLKLPTATGAVPRGGFQEDKTDTFSKLIVQPNFPYIDKTPEKPQLAVSQSVHGYDTPELELSPFDKLKNNTTTNNNRNPNSTANLLLKDSMLQLNESVIPPLPMTANTSKLKFRDSFVPDFSFLSETQEKNTTSKEITNNSKITKHKANDESFIPQIPKLDESKMGNINNDKSLIAPPHGLPTANESLNLKQQQQLTSSRNIIDSNESAIGINKSDFLWMQNKQNTTIQLEHQPNEHQHMLPDIFIKDFSALNMVPPSSKSSSNYMKFADKSNNTTKNSSIKESTVKFLDESKNTSTNDKSKMKLEKQKLPQHINNKNKGGNLKYQGSGTLKFLNDKSPSKSNKNLTNNYYEGNIETSQFNVDNSMIKNSTKLTEQPAASSSSTTRTSKSDQSYINENSIHIKEEPLHDDEMSIYYKKTPYNLKVSHAWDDAIKTPTDNQYVHEVIDFSCTQQIINEKCTNDNVNPFATALTNAFLEEIAFTEYAGKLPTCQLQRHVSRLKPEQILKVHEHKFEVIKFIGEGAYGSIYKGKHLQTGDQVALKQERPPNCWEYYICLEIRSRLQVDEMLPAFMSVDWALIGKNSSILISSFSEHGSLLQVCNKIYKHTNKHVDEYVVMHMTRELLELIDHLHAVNIIHADIKPDNFLLINMLSYNNAERSLQLIDFGVSIDMKLFQNSRQTFTFVHKQNTFNCVEMREGRPWTYQIDLYGLAGVIHVLLFGKYMEITKRDKNLWMPKNHIPRYFQQALWKNIFEKLLNVEDCFAMPDLQALRKDLKEVLVDHKQHAKQKLTEFNSIMCK